MAHITVVCPQCGSRDVEYNEGRGRYMCWECGHRFAVQQDAHSPANADKAETPLKIFLSYGHTEQEIVSRIKESLEARGHTVWFDTSEIKAGDDWRASIAEGVSSSNGVIACLSKHAFRDGGVCHDEIDIAVGVRGGNIKTVLLDPEAEVRPPSVLTHIQWLDMAIWREKLAAGPEEFEPWFEHCMAELDRVIESRESVQFAGDITEISQKLSVLADNSRQSDLLAKPFQGREWLTEEVTSWLDDRSSPRVCLITGDAGVGKSAFAAHLSHWDSKLTGRIAASVFCVRGRTSYNDAKVVIQTLAYLLACRIPQYRVLLKSTLNKNIDLGAIDEASLFALLITEPLSKAIDGGHECMAIVVDGIDEAGGVEQNALAEVIGTYAVNLPSWMKVLVTSRRASATTEPFGGGAHRIDIKGSSSKNMTDVRAHLAAQLKPSFGKEPDFEASVDAIAQGSGGAFLYAEYMVDAVLKGHAVLADAARKVPDGLGGMFHQWFRWTFPSMGEYRTHYREPLGCIMAAPGGALPVAELPVLFGWDGNQRNDFLRRVEVFLFRTEDMFGNEAIAFNHAFVAQWLASDSAGGYRSDPIAAQALMGRRWHAIGKVGPEKLSDYEAVNVLDVLEGAGMSVESAELWSGYRIVDRCMDTAHELWLAGSNSTALGIVSVIKRLFDSRGEMLTYKRSSILNIYGLLLSRAERIAESEAAYRESVSIRFEHLKPPSDNEDLDVIVSGYAYSLNGLGTLLVKAGRFSEAEGYVWESVEIRRGIAEDKSEDHLYDLARSLIKLGSIYQNVGTLDEAIACEREAVEIGRSLTDGDWYDRQSLLSDALNNLGIALKQAGDTKGSVEAFRESLAIRRKLAEERPQTYLQTLANSLSNLGNMHDKGDYSISTIEAEEFLRESISIRRELAKGDPHANSTGLADVLINLAVLLNSTGRSDEAESCYREALDIHQKLVNYNPQTHLADIATIHNNLGAMLYRLGRKPEAEDALRDAVSIRHRLAEVDPYAYLPMVASSTRDLGYVFEQEDRFAEAVDCYQRALNMYRDLEASRPGQHAPNVASALRDLGDALRGLGTEKERAAECYRQSALRYHELALRNLAAYQNAEDALYTLLGDMLVQLGNEPEAENAYRSSLDIRRLRFKANPEGGIKEYNWGVYRLAELLVKSGRYVEALTLYRELLAVREGFIESNPMLAANDIEWLCRRILALLNDLNHTPSDWMTSVGKDIKDIAEGKPGDMKPLFDKFLACIDDAIAGTQ